MDENIKRYVELVTCDKSKALEISFDSKVLEFNQHIARSEAEYPPTISFAAAASSKTYIVICIDLDGPYPSCNILSPILHWIQPGLTSSPSMNALTTNEKSIANYISPGPPPGSSPHRYVFLLYEQPDDFDGKKYAPTNGKEYGNLARMRFSLSGWEKIANLGSPVAVNCFMSN